MTTQKPGIVTFQTSNELYDTLNPRRFSSQVRSSLAFRSQSNTTTPSVAETVEDDSDDDLEEPVGLQDYEFESMFQPNEMRCLALVAHNHMKPAMKEFVLQNKNVLKKFRLTGTNTTMTMLREVFGRDRTVLYGPTCQSGPLGGDAELCALMCMEELGGMIFLQDPMDAHPHQADIECLNRQGIVHDILQASNVSSAYGMITVLRNALKTGNREIISTFFQTEYSPSVAEYKARQQTILESHMREISTNTITTVATEEPLYRRSIHSIMLEQFDDDIMENNLLLNLPSPGGMAAPPQAVVAEEDDTPNFKQVSFQKPKTSNTKRGISAGLQSIIETREEAQRTSVMLRTPLDMSIKVQPSKTFNAKFVPEDMRCLALVAHNHMKPAMKEFVLQHKHILKKFTLTGTNTTMTMLREVFGDDPSVRYGPTCQSGPLGGDAQLCALMCIEDLGGIVFLQDPMDSHPHQADIDCLNRQANVHDIYTANNISSARCMMQVLKHSLKTGDEERIMSFFDTRVSPSVAEYKKRQKAVSDKMSDKKEGNTSDAGKSRRRLLTKAMSTKSTRVMFKSVGAFLKGKKSV